MIDAQQEEDEIAAACAVLSCGRASRSVAQIGFPPVVWAASAAPHAHPSRAPLPRVASEPACVAPVVVQQQAGLAAGAADSAGATAVSAPPVDVRAGAVLDLSDATEDTLGQYARRIAAAELSAAETEAVLAALAERTRALTVTGSRTLAAAVTDAAQAGIRMFAEHYVRPVLATTSATQPLELLGRVCRASPIATVALVRGACAVAAASGALTDSVASLLSRACGPGTPALDVETAGVLCAQLASLGPLQASSAPLAGLVRALAGRAECAAHAEALRRAVAANTTFMGRAARTALDALQPPA